MAVIAIIGAVTAAVELTTAIIEATDDDSSEELVERINLMQSAIDKGFDEVGQAINDLANFIEQINNENILRDVVTAAQTAMDLLKHYKENGDENYRAEATALTYGAKNDLLYEDENINKVFFIGGLVLVGNAHIEMLRTHYADDFSTNAIVIQEVDEIADYLETLIQIIEQRIPGHHRVIERQVIDTSLADEIGNEPGVNIPPQVRNEMVYQKHGMDQAVFPFYCSGPACQLVPVHTKQVATELANEARLSGIAAEKEEQAVPLFRQTLEMWQNLIIYSQRRDIYEKFLGRAENILDLQRANRKYFQVAKEISRSKQTSGRYKGKERFAINTSIDARPLIVDVLTSIEFKSRILKKLDREEIYEEVVKRVFDRIPTKDEIVKLRRLEDELGYDGMIAGLIFGNEYFKDYGKGIPVGRAEEQQPSKKPHLTTKKTKEEEVEEA
jgi:hypothetical protein